MITVMMVLMLNGNAINTQIMEESECKKVISYYNIVKQSMGSDVVRVDCIKLR